MQIPSSHPSLPGHFPGSAVVPGVVILDVVLSSFQAEKGSEAVVVGMPSIKFISPLLPDQHFEVQFADKSGGKMAFTVVTGDRKVVTGSISYLSS